MKLLCLDFDGVLHSATDPVMLNFGPNAPAWQLEVGLKAQGRFAWANELADALELSDDAAIIIHSTWRRQFDDPTMRSFLPDGLRRRVICLDGQIDRSLDADNYVAAALDLIAPTTTCVLDDRPDFFSGCRVQQWIDANDGVMLWCTPKLGITEPEIRRQVQVWCQSSPSPKHHLSMSPSG
jgi:hypothetical protein